MECDKYQLKNKFEVSKLIAQVDVDFIYSYNSTLGDEAEYILLNNNMLGRVKKDIIEKLVVKNRVVLIDSHTMKMYVYNIPETELVPVLLGME